MSERLPLLTHTDLDAPVAWRAGEPVSGRMFLRDVAALAGRLPPLPEVLNLCADRYRFTVGFAAALVRGQVSLLPPSGSGGAVQEVAADHTRAYCLTDGASAPVPGLPELQWRGAEPDDRSPVEVPAVPATQVAAVAFTSGSTGAPQPHPKSWGTLVAGARLTGARLGLDRGVADALLATVPPQHMFGLETSVLLPLQWGCALVAERPFFAADVAAELARLPARTALITTPFHIRALAAEPTPLPPAAFLLSATAPLSRPLAAEAEARSAAPVLELFGTTETGAIATRRTALDPVWQALPGIRLMAEGEKLRVAGGHLPEPVALPDRFELRGPDRFLLLGRGNELINIAGKRMALGDLTARLLSLPGVEDAAVLIPDEAADRVDRLAALVVAPGRTPAELVAALRACIDPVFLPRPLKLVPHLPRSGTGKLPRAELLRLLEEG